MFEKLYSLLDGNEEALRLLGDIETTQKSLTSDINKLEVKFEEAKNFRDTIKNENRLVKDKLGVDVITEEAISSFFNKQGDSAELDNLKLQLENAVREKTDVENTYKKQLGDYVLKTELTKTNLATDALNPTMYGILEKIALDGATYDNGTVVYKNPDGSTKYGSQGKPLSLADRVEELRHSEDYASLFKPKQNGGTGSQGNKGGLSGKAPSEYSEAERVQLFKENPDKFKQLFGKN